MGRIFFVKVEKPTVTYIKKIYRELLAYGFNTPLNKLYSRNWVTYIVSS